jgi:uncharacterized membrane protein
VLVIDWLRGVAVLLMMLWHSYDAWLAPSARAGLGFDLIRFLSGLPSRLFVFLVGVSVAVVYEKQIAQGVSAREMRARTAKRGLQVLGLAYLFRLQEQLLAAFHGGWEPLFRVDVLNCIGASMLVLALVTTPRAGRKVPGDVGESSVPGRPRYAAALLGAAVFLGLGPIIGPAHFPTWMPRPVTSYLGGQRPMSWFALFPWGAWALVGVAVGHVWLRWGRDPRRQAWCFVVTGLLGALSTGTVMVVRAIDPYVIRYPSEVVQQMGPGSFFYRLGWIGALAFLGWVVTRLSGTRYSPVRQLGQTSLFIYWIHVELCYGFISHPLHKRLSLPGATVAFATLTAAMYGLSVLKTRRGREIGRWFAARVRAFVASRRSTPVV